MNNDEVDSILTSDEEVTPSPDFTVSVMQAVRQLSALEPIRFPWVRALPGLAALCILLAVCISLMIRGVSTHAASIATITVGSAALADAQTYVAGWVGLALLLTLFSVMLSVRLTGAKARSWQF